MRFGLDLLGAARYPKLAAGAVPVGWSLGLMDKTFESPDKKLLPVRNVARQAIANGCRKLRIHLMWKDDHRYTVADFAVIAQRASKWVELVLQHPEVDWEFSGGCENNYKAPQAKALAERILNILPTCTYVNSPCKEGSQQGEFIYGPKIKNEVHGFNAPKPASGTPYNWSADGDCAVDKDIESAKHRYSDCTDFYIWDARANGLWELPEPGEPKTPRYKRTGWPDRKQIDSWVVLAGPRGDCWLTRSWTLKSHAENDGTGDWKAEKNCLIAKVKLASYEYRRNGRKIATLKYVGPFTGGGWRYYTSVMGFQLSTAGVHLHGSDGKEYGFINPAFRFGTFR